MKASATVKPGGWGRRTLILALSFTLATSLAACGGTPPGNCIPVEPIVIAQITNLESGDFTVRRCAARALGRIGPKAKNAVPALLRALEDSEPTVRDAAKVALGRIDPAALDRALVLLADAHCEARR